MLRQSFYGREDLGLEAKLADELPGILNWAIAGWQRLADRGHFVPPASSAEAVQAIEDLSSPIGAFLRDNCDVAPGKRVERTQLFEAWCAWCRHQGRDKPGTAAVFGRDLHARLPQIRSSQPREDGMRVRFYEGLALK